MSKERVLSDFTDIVEPRRKNGDAVSFMTKCWRPQMAYKVMNPIAPADIKTLTLQSKRLKGALDILSVSMNLDRDEITKEVKNILEEIGLERKMFVVRSLGIFTTKVLCRMCNSVFVNERKFFTLKSLLGSNPVVFVPTHRSYADFVLMTYLCYYYEIELPAVAAGMDFHSMVAMGRIMRDTCAFYIRRTFSTDKLYSAVFKQYVRTLITNYHAPISFFIEGTRSRSNKSLAPKYGFMTMVLEPFFTREIPDITFVPVHLNYNRVMEEKLFAYELLGVPKPKESTSALLKALSILNDNYGDIYVNVGEPISAKEYFKDSMNRNAHAIKPVELIDLSQEENCMIQNLSHEIICRQQSIAVVTTFQLIAVLMAESVQSGTLMSLNDLHSNVIWLSEFIKLFHDHVFDYNKSNIESEIKTVLSSHKNLINVDKDCNVRLINTTQFTLTEEIKNKMKGHQLSEKTMCNVIPVMMIQLYANPVLSYLINPAVLSILVNKEPLSEDQLWERYQSMRILFKNEFPFNDKTLYNVFQCTFDKMLENSVLIRDKEKNIMNGNDVYINKLLQSSMWPFLCCLYRLTIIILELKTVDEKLLVKICQKHIEEVLLEGNVHPYSLSLDTISNCIQGFVAEGSLKKLKRDTAIIYTVNNEKMMKTSIWLDSILLKFDVNYDLNNPVVLNQTGIFAKL